MDGHVARTCLKGGGAMLPIPSIAVVSGLREAIRLGREILSQRTASSGPGTLGCAGLLRLYLPPPYNTLSELSINTTYKSYNKYSYPVRNPYLCTLYSTISITDGSRNLNRALRLCRSVAHTHL